MSRIRRSSNRPTSTLAVLVVAGALVACGPRATSPPPRAPEQSQFEQSQFDGGLPRPAPSTKRGVIVPTDVGFGAGAAGPAPTSGTISPVSPDVGGPPAIGH